MIFSKTALADISRYLDRQTDTNQLFALLIVSLWLFCQRFHYDIDVHLLNPVNSIPRIAKAACFGFTDGT